MPVSNTDNRWTHNGDGVSDAFSYGNLIFAAADLKVYDLDVSTTVLSWFSTAMLDGKISVTEMAEFIEGIATIWKMRIELDLTDVANNNLLSELVPDDMDDFETARADFSGA